MKNVSIREERISFNGMVYEALDIVITSPEEVENKKETYNMFHREAIKLIRNQSGKAQQLAYRFFLKTVNGEKFKPQEKYDVEVITDYLVFKRQFKKLVNKYFGNY